MASHARAPGLHAIRGRPSRARTWPATCDAERSVSRRTIADITLVAPVYIGANSEGKMPSRQPRDAGAVGSSPSANSGARRISLWLARSSADVGGTYPGRWPVPRDLSRGAALPRFEHARGRIDRPSGAAVDNVRTPDDARAIWGTDCSLPHGLNVARSLPTVWLGTATKAAGDCRLIRQMMRSFLMRVPKGSIEPKTS